MNLPPVNTASEDARERVLLHMPVDVRSVSLAVLALIASLFAMQWAKEILIPILLGVMLSYALTPVVDRFERWKIPRAAGAAVLLAAIGGAIAWGAWSLSDQADTLVETLPQVAEKIRQMTQDQHGTVSTIEKVQLAATEIEAAANATPPPASGVASAASTALGQSESAARLRTQPGTASRSQSVSRPADGLNGSNSAPRIDVRGYVLSGTLSALAFLGQIVIVFFIALFLMASGSNFRRKMVKLAGPKLSQKKVTIETLNEISEQIQRYLLVQVGVSILVGVATWLAFYAIGVHQSAVWGVVAAVTNLIPYLGAILVGAGSAVVSLFQFGTLAMAILVGGTSFAIHTLIGNLLAPWWMGRAGRMSPFAVFVSVLLFGWLWGISGLLLGVPILMVVKSVCDRVEDLKPVGELLGD
jgi:predicted PurR-regulated permease PerM